MAEELQIEMELAALQQKLRGLVGKAQAKKEKGGWPFDDRNVPTTTDERRALEELGELMSDPSNTLVLSTEVIGHRGHRLRFFGRDLILYCRTDVRYAEDPGDIQLVGFFLLSNAEATKMIKEDEIECRKKLEYFRRLIEAEQELQRRIGKI